MIRPSARNFKHKKLIPFLDGEARAKAFKEPGYRVRLFDPRGHYPAGIIANANALYWGAPDLTFMVTWSEPWDWHGREMPYTEMDWATLQELRLMASILLCEREDGPRVCFYPIHRFSMYFDVPQLKLQSAVVARRIKDSIIERSWHPNMMQGEGSIQKCLEGSYKLFQSPT